MKAHYLLRLICLLALLLVVACSGGDQVGRSADNGELVGAVEPLNGSADELSDSAESPQMSESSRDNSSDEDRMSDSNSSMSGGSGNSMSSSSNNSMSSGNSMMGGGESFDPVGDTSIEDRHLHDDKYSDDQIRATELVIAVERMAEYLVTQEPNWQVSSHYDETKEKWYVDFYNEDGQWFGFGGVKFSDEIVDEMDLPRILDEEQIAAEEGQVRAAFLADPEVVEILGDPAEWYINPEYSEQDGDWTVYFERGIESWEAEMIVQQDGVRVYALVDPLAFDEEEKNEIARNEALELASSAEGLWEVLEDVSEWQAFVEPLGNSEYTVSYVGDGSEIFFAVVNIDSWELLEFGSVQ